MKIVIAPDSYKESLSAAEVARAIEAGFREVFPDARFQCLPVADGGEGTVDAMVAATGGRRVAVRVTNHPRSWSAPPMLATYSAFISASREAKRW